MSASRAFAALADLALAEGNKASAAHLIEEAYAVSDLWRRRRPRDET